jgi:hypothetical protein
MRDDHEPRTEHPAAPLTKDRTISQPARAWAGDAECTPVSGRKRATETSQPRSPVAVGSVFAHAHRRAPPKTETNQDGRRSHRSLNWGVDRSVFADRHGRAPAKTERCPSRSGRCWRPLVERGRSALHRSGGVALWFRDQPSTLVCICSTILSSLTGMAARHQRQNAVRALGPSSVIQSVRCGPRSTAREPAAVQRFCLRSRAWPRGSKDRTRVTTAASHLCPVLRPESWSAAVQRFCPGHTHRRAPPKTGPDLGPPWTDLWPVLRARALAAMCPTVCLCSKTERGWDLGEPSVDPSGGRRAVQ